METALSILIPISLLTYYLWSDWQNMKTNRILMGVLIGGTLLYYLGLAFAAIDPVLESLLKLSGACLFFTGIALHTVRRSKVKNPDPKKDQDETN